MSLKEKEQLIDISANFELRSKFNETELTKFWITLRNEFPEISIQLSNFYCDFGQFICARKYSHCMQPPRLNTETA